VNSRGHPHHLRSHYTSRLSNQSCTCRYANPECLCTQLHSNTHRSKWRILQTNTVTTIQLQRRAKHQESHITPFTSEAHSAPNQPLAHAQVNEPTVSVHVAPFRQPPLEVAHSGQKKDNKFTELVWVWSDPRGQRLVTVDIETARRPTPGRGARAGARASSVCARATVHAATIEGGAL
jgi:hypothetical protein